MSICGLVYFLQIPQVTPWKVGRWPIQIPPHDIVVQHHPHYQQQEEVGLVCRGIGQVVAVNVRCDLRAQYHVLVQSDDGRHRIYYLVELEFCICGQIGAGQEGQLVVVGTAS